MYKRQPGAWLVSLDFAVPDVEATLALRPPHAQPVWAYRVPGTPPKLPRDPGRSGFVAQPASVPADNPSNKSARPGWR